MDWGQRKRTGITGRAEKPWFWYEKHKKKITGQHSATSWGEGRSKVHLGPLRLKVTDSQTTKKKKKEVENKRMQPEKLENPSDNPFPD